MRMPSIIAATVCLVAWALSAAAYAGERGIVVRESRDPAPRAIPLKFRLHRTEWEDGYLHVWGEVKNPTNHDYDFVEVIFVALDRNRKQLGRTDAFCEPETLNRGEAGYITDESIDTQGREPAVLEYRVIGFKASRH